MTCHNCRIECRKAGKRPDGVQRYRCAQCSKTFSEPNDFGGTAGNRWSGLSHQLILHTARAATAGTKQARERTLPMKDFPEFMKHAKNRIATSSQSTPGVEGYVFDGADGSQMAFWTCSQTAVSAAHAHDFDEYMPVFEGCYTLMIGGEKIPVPAGE